MKDYNIILEIGQNHNGDFDKCLQMIDRAAELPIDYIKFVKREKDLFPAIWKEKSYNGAKETTNYYDHRCALEFTDEQFDEIIEYTLLKNLKWGSSFTDIPSLEFIKRYDPNFLKIASSRIVDYPLLEKVCEFEGLIIISSGMSENIDTDKFLDMIEGVNKYVLLQCTSCYPSLPEDIHINVIKHWAMNKGLSLHIPEISPAVAGYALGARWFEYHFTLEPANPHPDHQSALTPAKFIELNRSLDIVSRAMGSPHKQILPCEEKAIKSLRWDLC